VLEIGCHTGYIGNQFTQAKFYGLDVDSDALKQASNGYCGVQEVDLNRIDPENFEFDFRDVKFNVLLAGDVLEHLLNPQTVLKYFLGFVESGGRVIVSVPNVANIRIRLLLLFGRFEYTDRGILDRSHLHLYTRRSAKSDFAGCFKLEQIYYGSSNFGWIIRWLPMLGPLFGNTIILCGRK
jgi:2-polyprenyl-3-methyl-5-hydroxy-6-metoxy-1,4-benzoquinol methylase